MLPHRQTQHEELRTDAQAFLVRALEHPGPNDNYGLRLRTGKELVAPQRCYSTHGTPGGSANDRPLPRPTRSPREGLRDALYAYSLSLSASQSISSPLWRPTAIGDCRQARDAASVL